MGHARPRIRWSAICQVNLPRFGIFKNGCFGLFQPFFWLSSAAPAIGGRLRVVKRQAIQIVLERAPR
jgi:hypothetical protein